MIHESSSEVFVIKICCLCSTLNESLSVFTFNLQLKVAFCLQVLLRQSCVRTALRVAHMWIPVCEALGLMALAGCDWA